MRRRTLAAGLLVAAPAAAEDGKDAAGKGLTIGALFTAAVSIGLAGWGHLRTSRLEREKAEATRALAAYQADAARDLKRLEVELATAKAVTDARTEYEWGARQKLFEQLEPVIFQTGEVMEAAVTRIRNLAGSHRRGRLGAGPESWMDRADGDAGYYLATTAFRVLRPVACFRLMNEKMTRVDLSLEPDLQGIFLLAKLYRDLLTAPFILCRQAPALAYDYVHPEPGKPYQVAEEARHYIQHLYTDQLDAAVDALTDADRDGHTILRRYGGLAALLEAGQAMPFRSALLLFRRFSPPARPVLWRVLLAMALVGKVMLDVLAERNRNAPATRTPLAARIAAEAEAAWTAELSLGDAAALRAELAACVAAITAWLEEPLMHIRVGRSAAA